MKKNGQRTLTVWVAAWAFSWGALACSDGVSCKDEPKAPGVWRDVGHPNDDGSAGEGSSGGGFETSVASDGKSLILLGTLGCDFCQINVLDPVTLRWEILPTTGEVPFTDGGGFAATEEYLFVTGGIDLYLSQGYNIVHVSSIALLDRSTREWTVHEPPEELQIRSNSWVFWTGEEFLMWGGDKDGSSYLDGALFNPKEKTWRYVPPLHPEVAAEQPLYRFVSAEWTARGLIVWGGTPNDNTPIHALYSVEQQKWIPIEVDASFERLTPGLLGYGDDLYFYSGRLLASGDGMRDFWRYSLSKGTWTQLLRPDYAEPGYRQIVGDKFVFWGSCPSGTTYNPKTDTWSVLTSTNRPPTIGESLSASDRFLVFGAHAGEYPTYRIWVLDPNESSPE